MADVVASVADVLADSLSPVLAYNKLLPLLGSFDLRSTVTVSRLALVSALGEVEQYPNPTMIGLGSAQGKMIQANTIRRAAYIVSATKRIASELTKAEVSGGTLAPALSAAVKLEDRYVRQHVTASAQRMLSANQIDALAGLYGDVLGWYADTDAKTTPECLAANGKNFRASEPPAIGYPGTVHMSCRCHPGPPYRGAELLSSSSAPIPVAAVSNQLRFAQLRKQVSKSSVSYRAAVENNRRCGTCVMYHASKCDLVEGFIRPDYVCNRWEAKPIELAYFEPGGPAIRHVRSARGVYFFKEPIGTPITEAEYDSLKAAEAAARQARLDARRDARSKYPAGHPTRIAAERAVREGRKAAKLSGSTGQDAVADELADAHASADKLLKGEELEAEVIGKGPSTGSSGQDSVADELAKAHASADKLLKTTRPEGASVQSNFVTRASDRRISQGQTQSNFFLASGSAMSKSESGDTYEEMFRTKGAKLIEKAFGGKYSMISHAEGGARNTPLDFQMGEYGGEIKSLSVLSRNQKTAIKKEELDRKAADLAKRGLKPLMVVQVVDQKSGEVKVYAHPAFASKKVSTMRQIGSYKYTPDDFEAARKRAGYIGGPGRSADKEPPSARSEMAARLTDDQQYQKLLDERKAAQKAHPVGHPTRVAAERAVRQARKKLHGGEPTPQPKPAAKAYPDGRPEWVKRELDPRGTNPLAGETNKPLTPVITHDFTWSTYATTGPKGVAEKAFRKQAEDAINTQFAHQSSFLPNLITSANRIVTTITEDPNPEAEGNSALGSYLGNRKFGDLRLHPKIFPHEVETASRIHRAPFWSPNIGEDPQGVLDTASKSGWWVPIDDKWTLSDSVIAHELGHAVNDSVFAGNSSHAGIPDDEAFWSEFAKTLGIVQPSRTMVSTTKKTYLRDNIVNWMRGSHNRSVLQDRVSKYGGDDANPQEMFAELWAEYTLSSNPRPPAKFYGEYVAQKLREQSVESQHPGISTPPITLDTFDPLMLAVGETKTFPFAEVERVGKYWFVNKLGINGELNGFPMKAMSSEQVLSELNRIRVEAGGVRSLSVASDVASRLEAARASGTPELSDPFHEGEMAETHVATYPNGSKWIAKVPKVYDAPEKEELASKISDILGAGAPQVIREAEKLTMPFVEGKSPAELHLDLVRGTENDTSAMNQADRKYYAELTKLNRSPQGKLIGLLDIITDNGDRNEANWISANGTPVPIDHGETWNRPYADVAAITGDRYASPFIKTPLRWIATGRVSSEHRLAPQDFTPTKVGGWRSKLEELAKDPSLSQDQRDYTARSVRLFNEFFSDIGRDGESPHELAARELTEAKESGQRSAEAPVAKGQHKTTVAVFNNGAKFIDKHANTIKTVEKEELASRVSDIIGAGAPAVIRDSQDGRHLYQPFVNGKLALELWRDIGGFSFYSEPSGEALRGHLEDLADSREGQLIGLLDTITGNGDRNESNWLISPDGKPVPIDHGESWNEAKISGPQGPGLPRYVDAEKPIPENDPTAMLSALSMFNERLIPSDFSQQELLGWQDELEKLSTDPELSKRQQTYMQWTLRTFDLWRRGIRKAGR